MAFAYLAGGCFWCITPVFARHTGVLGVKSGYSGGCEQNPTYEAVKHQQTDHRETIRVEYDPEAVSFGELLELFLQNTDPFDADGQFIDRGHSYTLAVYWQSAAEKQTAEEKLKRLEEDSGKKTGVTIEPFDTFWLAEEYHQDYYRKNPEAFEEELISSGRKKPDREIRIQNEMRSAGQN